MMIALTLIQFILIAFFVANRDVQRYMCLLGAITLLNIIQFGTGYYYERMMCYDLLYIVAAFILKDSEKLIGVTIVCITSFLLNWYEYTSYYQTEFYPYRGIINSMFIQAVILIACVDCDWRVPWKTNTQK